MAVLLATLKAARSCLSIHVSVQCQRHLKTFCLSRVPNRPSRAADRRLVTMAAGEGVVASAHSRSICLSLALQVQSSGHVGAEGNVQTAAF